MSWVTWRQHRLEGLWVLVLSLLMGISIAFVANELRIANCSGPGQSPCLPVDAWGGIAQILVKFNLYTYALVVLPALAGAFISVPLVAREIENGTQRLVWTQGVTRTRWFITKVVLVFAPLLTAAAVLGYLEVVLIDVQGAQANRWAFFDQQAPMTVASTLFALALGTAVGAIMGRSIPAMAVTLVAFVVVRIGIAELARPNFMAPLVYRSSNMNIGVPGTSWWLGNAEFYDAAGHVVGTRQAASYFVEYFQPGDRFWPFQTIESVILAVMALLILGVAAYWTTRRVS